MSPILWSIGLCIVGLLLILLDAMVPSGGVLTVLPTCSEKLCVATPPNRSSTSTVTGCSPICDATGVQVTSI